MAEGGPLLREALDAREVREFGVWDALFEVHLGEALLADGKSARRAPLWTKPSPWLENGMNAATRQMRCVMMPRLWQLKRLPAHKETG